MLIVSDSSPLIVLAICNKLDLLDALFDKVIIPQAVFTELAIPGKPGAEKIIEWAENKVVSVKNRAVVTAFSMNLDIGESEALSLYWETSADFLLIDEKRCRTIAQRNGINIIGTMSILLQAKQKRFLTLVKPSLDILMQSNIRISDTLYQKVLEKAGEARRA